MLTAVARNCNSKVPKPGCGLESEYGIEKKIYTLTHAFWASPYFKSWIHPLTSVPELRRFLRAFHTLPITPSCLLLSTYFWYQMKALIESFPMVCFLSRHRSAERQCWWHVCMYVVRSTCRNNVDRIGPSHTPSN